MEKILLQDYIPKNDTQQSEFLKKYPKYDGRGVLIAVIDNGVDVSLPGMQKTSTRFPKIIDCYDFTGYGDVDTSHVRKVGKDNILIGLNGRKMKIPQSWKNPSGKWHLGIKSRSDLNARIFDKIKEKNENKKLDDEKHVQEHKNAAVKPKQACKNYKNFTKNTTKNDDIDCIVWNDGQRWQACIVSSFCDDLENIKVLTNFRDSHEYCVILENIACCVTIYNNGNLLEIFFPDDHASYVAQVAAASFPQDFEKSGLAPGAQIVSMNFSNDVAVIEKIFNKCIELGVDIINLSIGCYAFNDRTIIPLLKKMVKEHGIIIVKSAGNFGPFVSSIKGDTQDANDEIFTVGAIFTTDITNANEKCSPTIAPYSSKGPLPNGARGVTFVAPVNAIIANPLWHPSKKIIFGGTSCASPIAAGSIACLLSALKANSIKYTPSIIKMAISNTAFLPDGGDRLKFGNGIIQINSAFEYFKNNSKHLSKIIFPKFPSNKKGIVIYETKCGTSSSFAKIDILNSKVTVIEQSIPRDYFEKDEKGDFEQVLSKKKKKQQRLHQINEQNLNENIKKTPQENNHQQVQQQKPVKNIIQKCHEKAFEKEAGTNIYSYRIPLFKDIKQQISWIMKLAQEDKNPKHVEYSKTVTNNLLNVKINTKNLEAGNLYYSEIHGYNSKHLSLGPIFHFPITVIVPQKVVYSFQREVFIKPPSMFNLFLEPLESSYKCLVKLIDPENGEIEFEKQIKKVEHVHEGKWHLLSPKKASSTANWYVSIRWNKIFEICIHQGYSTRTDFELKANLCIYFEKNAFVNCL